MHNNSNTCMLLQVKGAVETLSKRRVTHHEQVIGLLIGAFFIFEVLGMLILDGIYFGDNFTGVCFLLLSDFR